MRVTFLTPDPDSASARIRVRAFLPALRAAGIEAELVGAKTTPPEAVRGDVVVLHRMLLPAAELSELRGRVRRLLFDVDDAVWCRPGGRRSRRLEGRLRATLNVCDLVVCGSRALERIVVERGARATRLLPPAPPTPEGRAEPAKHSGLVWIGSAATLPYLEALAPTLAEVGTPVEIVADRAPQLPSVEVRFTPWSEAAEAEALQRAGVGLYPLADDDWCRGKCAYKVRRYMSFGLPTVASPWGGAEEVLGPPEAGLTAETPAGWWACLKRLLEDPALRHAMGRRARARALALEDPIQRARAWVHILAD